MILGKRPAACARDKSKIAAWSSGQCFGKNWQNRQRDRHSSLFGLDHCDRIANMLAAKPHGVTSAQASIEQNVEPYPLARSDRPPLLIGGHVILHLGTKATTFGAGRVFYSFGWIKCHQTSFERPSEQELTELGLVQVASRGAFGVHDRKSRISDKREPAKPKIGISLQGGGPETFRILSDLPSNED